MRGRAAEPAAAAAEATDEAAATAEADAAAGAFESCKVRGSCCSLVVLVHAADTTIINYDNELGR